MRANACGVPLPKRTRTQIVERQRTTGNPPQKKRARSRAACVVTRLHVRCMYVDMRCACDVGRHFSIHGDFVYPISTTSTAPALPSRGLPPLLMYCYTLDKDFVQHRGTIFLRTHIHPRRTCLEKMAPDVRACAEEHAPAVPDCSRLLRYVLFT